VIAIYLDLDLDLDLDRRWGLHKAPLFKLWRCCTTDHIIEKKKLISTSSTKRDSLPLHPNKCVCINPS
jgi:hypothetical protein